MERVFDFWKDHSDTFIKMAHLWDRRKSMELPDGYGKKKGDCGDTITLYLAVKDGTITEVNFELEGCLNTSACCNALAVLAEGKMLEQCWEITPNDIICFLETLPSDHHHCAELAVGAFYRALADYSERKNRKLNL